MIPPAIYSGECRGCGRDVDVALRLSTEEVNAAPYQRVRCGHCGRTNALVRDGVDGSRRQEDDADWYVPWADVDETFVDDDSHLDEGVVA